jgi:two-component system cell cycle sensor histidine kinase/response regulator CckA
MAEINPSGSLILVVDDEPIVLRAVTGALAVAGFRVMVAENGAAGLEAFMSSADEVALVLADVVMPFMSGIEMAERIREIQPNAKIVFMSGYSEAVVLRDRGMKVPLLRKPFLNEDVVRVVRANLDPPTASA